MNDLVSRFSHRSDLHQSPMHASVMREIGWDVDGEPSSQIFFRKLGPLSIAKIQRPKELDIAWLSQFRKDHKTLTTYIEPGLTTPLPKEKFGMHVEPFAHSCTSLIDLSIDTKEILNSFSQKTRYNIVHTLRKNELRIVSSSLGNLSNAQIDSFFELHHLWSHKKGVVGYPVSLLNAILKCHKETGELFLAYQEEKLVACLLTLYHDHVATYYAAFALPAGYKSFAPTLLTWTAIERVKDRGCDIFDFGGIYDPRYPKMYKRWQGFTKFKEGFNPTVISYPPTSLQLFW